MGNRGRKRKACSSTEQRKKRQIPSQTRAQARTLRSLLDPTSLSQTGASGSLPAERPTQPARATSSPSAATQDSSTRQSTPNLRSSTGRSAARQPSQRLPPQPASACGSLSTATPANPHTGRNAADSRNRPSPRVIQDTGSAAAPNPTQAPPHSAYPGTTGTQADHSGAHITRDQPSSLASPPAPLDGTVPGVGSTGGLPGLRGPPGFMVSVNEEAMRLLGASFSASTWGSYSRGAERFRQFRLQSGLPQLWPAPCTHIAAFIAFLSLEGLAPSTIGTYLAAVAYIHKINNWPDPTDNFLVHKLREGCRRLGRSTDTRRPITIDLLGKICNILGATTSSIDEAALFRAAFLLAFFGFLRVGEFTVSRKSDDQSRILNYKDVWVLGSTPELLVIKLRFSKTDQRGESAELQFHRQPHSAICPVGATLQYLQVRPKVAGPFFCHFDHSPLTTYQFNRMLRACLEALNLSPQGFSSHSFRIGAATSAALNGFSIVQIQQLGRWRSHAVKLYIRPDKIG
ncbi:uncharacterized protein LOC110986066 [Acanthaster planci]|uniref:Uncharacterized protein LOC110986066 n=1 Tax=Acanthaster planci TaxID=133434 RepID=A0A8B7ZEF0_ACAPL|nr:uncharacterized protein LOC110986066 [Acanthaster planci]